MPILVIVEMIYNDSYSFGLAIRKGIAKPNELLREVATIK